ncbi:MAG: heavy metal translocating P-type ATPase [Peptoniphilaceae bacterium]|jgi:Cd2+/Zn2+-exporting ATPase
MKEYILQGLGCAQCAAKMEDGISRLATVEKAEINFINRKLQVQAAAYTPELLASIESIVQSIEPGVVVIEEAKHESDHTQADRSMLLRLGIGCVLFAAGFFITAPLPRLLCFFSAYLIAGYRVLIHAVQGVLRGQPFNENFLMGIATIGAFAIGEYPEGTAVMLFYLVGEVFQDMAVDRSRRSIRALMDTRPDTAIVIRNGEAQTVPSEEVKTGEILRIRPGDRVPMDGIVRSGEAMLDTSALTGESVPRRVRAGDEVLSGSIDKDGVLELIVTRTFGESTMAKILALVENAAAKKAPTEQFITKFARIYTPAVVMAALLLAVLPPLFLPGALFSDWLYRALIFLVVSCPCALVVSIPLGFFGGIGRASKQGILIKGGNYLEALNQADTVIFDKTGTLTKGEFAVQSVLPAIGTEEELLAWAALAESHSTHPIAASIRKSSGHTDKKRIHQVEEIAGQGVKAQIDNHLVLVGNKRLLEQHGVSFPGVREAGTIVYVAKDGRFMGSIIISDALKADAKEAVSALHKAGIQHTALLTGDREEVAAAIAKELGVHAYRAELLPAQKVKALEQLETPRRKNGKTVFVGDGINDAPVLARADIGIAMGGVGSDAAIEAADIVLMTDEPSKVATALRIAKETRRIVIQNIVFSLGIKALVLILSVLGIATMWGAVFADVGVTVIAVINSMRLLR